ncbi:hypothetical protein QQF64_017570 [Cirrhinus molitorella]|uniref:Uncharacterized protein n=1 Tax=Cirrhinus molitorella TaxID=172907 RepID=A0ABR3LJ19_9TELE
MIRDSQPAKDTADGWLYIGALVAKLGIGLWDNVGVMDEALLCIHMLILYWQQVRGELIRSADGLISVDRALQGLFFTLVSLESDGSRVDSGGV